VKHPRLRSRHLVTVAVALATAAASALVAAPGAHASPRQPGTTNAHHSTPMTTVRVATVGDHPDSAGRVSVRLVNGAVIAIPAADRDRVARRAAQAPVSPNGTVVGNCGSSYVTLQEKANQHPVRMTTGFTVDTAAVAYGWQATITGPNNYSYTYDSSGGLLLRTSWDGSYDSPRDLVAGGYSAAVVPAESFAELWTGDICFSGGPTDQQNLTSPDTPISMPLSFGPQGPNGHPTATVGPGATASPTTSSPASVGSDRRVAPFSVIGTDTRTRVPDTTAYPFRAVALLNVTNPDGTTDPCTGFFYAPNIVVTAGHCVYFPPAGGWATRIQVIPGNDVDANGKPVTPYGTCLGTTAFTTTGWVQNDDPRYDYGAVKLNCSTGSQTGWLGLSWTTAPLTGTAVTITGYPGDKPPAGSMWTASGRLTGDAERQVFYTISTSGGQSGSPVYAPGCGLYCALAVHAYGVGGSHPNSNAGTRITQAAFDNYQNWKS
jgi:glutamyl endopeptidase